MTWAKVAFRSAGAVAGGLLWAAALTTGCGGSGGPDPDQHAAVVGEDGEVHVLPYDSPTTAAGPPLTGREDGGPAGTPPAAGPPEVSPPCAGPPPGFVPERPIIVRRCRGGPMPRAHLPPPGVLFTLWDVPCP